jgi:DNA-binding transcriptional MerR regulator
MRAALSIGDFSQITHLSVKTLRRYHEAGLLEPAEVDPQSGYRYYSTAQVPMAQVIRRFRELGMPVREVGDVLATADPQVRSALIARHLERLENRLDETRAAVTSLRRLLQPAPPPIEVEHRTMPATMTAAIRATVEREDVLDWYGGAMTELDRTMESLELRTTGACGGLYDNELFTDERLARLLDERCGTAQRWQGGGATGRRGGHQRLAWSIADCRDWMYPSLVTVAPEIASMFPPCLWTVSELSCGTA